MRYVVTMDATRWTVLGVFGCAVAAALGFWLTFPDSGSLAPQPIEPTPVGEPPVVVARAPTPRPVRTTPRPAARAPRAAPRAPRAERAAPVERAPREVPEELVQAIEAARADNVAQSEAKVIAYAEHAGWSESQTDQVLGLVAAAHEDVDRLLVEVTEGERAWRDAKAEVRQVRVDQARAIRDELGDEAFYDFARALKMTSSRGRGGRGGRGARGR